MEALAVDLTHYFGCWPCLEAPFGADEGIPAEDSPGAPWQTGHQFPAQEVTVLEVFDAGFEAANETEGSLT